MRFVYCDQLNALMAFAWIEWYVLLIMSINVARTHVLSHFLNRSLFTVAAAFILVRGIIVVRRGDGYGSQLVSTA